MKDIQYITQEVAQHVLAETKQGFSHSLTVPRFWEAKAHIKSYTVHISRLMKRLKPN